MKGSLDELFNGRPVRQPVDIPPQGEKKEPDSEAFGRCVSLQRRSSLFGVILRNPREEKALDYYDVEIDIANDSLKVITGARKVWLIEIRGRNLRRLAPLLKERKVEWMAQVDRDFGQEESGEPLITSLVWTDVTERQQED
jgi:hypothetical protein